MFLTLLYILFICASLLVIFLLVAFWRKPPPWLPVARDMRSIWLLISMVIFLVCFYIVHDELVTFMDEYASNANQPEIVDEQSASTALRPQAPVSLLREEERLYVERVFKPLLNESVALNDEANKMAQATERVYQLIEQHPSSRGLLNQALLLLEKDQNQHEGLQSKIAQEVRNAYIHASVQNPDAIDQKFRERAIVLHKELHAARQGLQSNISQVGNLLDARLIESRERLKSKNILKKDRASFVFLGHTQQTLIAYRRERESTLTKNIMPDETVVYARESEDQPDQKPINSVLSGVNRMVEIRSAAIVRKDKLQSFLQKNESLKVPLQKTMALWDGVDRLAYDYLFEIFYAIEAEYLSEQLGMPARHPNLMSLDKVLITQVRKYVRHLEKTTDTVGRSFNLPTKY